MAMEKKSWILLGVGLLAGGVGGFCYWYFVGCTTGCAITSSPVNSTLYGSVMGALTFNMFRTSAKKTES